MTAQRERRENPVPEDFQALKDYRVFPVPQAYQVLRVLPVMVQEGVAAVEEDTLKTSCPTAIEDRQVTLDCPERGAPVVCEVQKVLQAYQVHQVWMVLQDLREYRAYRDKPDLRVFLVSPAVATLRQK